jgi:PTH1 family peptidyl-tRNA hydrolase
MKLIVGLGNPGAEYQNSRHNIGFMVLDSMADLWGVHFEAHKKLKSELLVTMKNSETLILAKPQTFMNLSGIAVQKIAHFYKINSKDVLVISDDIDLEFGKIRVRTQGSSGGHNGLQNIIDSIGKEFIRIRVGVGSNRAENIPAENYVLQPFSASQMAQLPEIIENTIKHIAKVLDTKPGQSTK